MPKWCLRLFALLLIPCLVTDPMTAQAYVFSSVLASGIAACSAGAFESQALTQSLWRFIHPLSPHLAAKINRLVADKQIVYKLEWNKPQYGSQLPALNRSRAPGLRQSRTRIPMNLFFAGNVEGSAIETSVLKYLKKVGFLNFYKPRPSSQAIAYWWSRHREPLERLVGRVLSFHDFCSIVFPGKPLSNYTTSWKMVLRAERRHIKLLKLPTQRPKVDISDDHAALCRKAFELFKDTLLQKRSSALGPVFLMPTGNTPIPLWEHIVHAAAHLDASGKPEIDLRNATIFMLDELVGGHEYKNYIQAIIDRLPENNRPKAVHVLDGKAKSWEKEVRRYEQLIDDSGGVDLCILGIGRSPDEHIGMNKAGSLFNSRTRLVDLDAETQKDTGHTQALTVGIGTILKSKKILLLANDSKKALPVSRLFTHFPDEAYPATSLLLHSDVTVLLDRAAAAQIPFNRQKLLDFFTNLKQGPDDGKKFIYHVSAHIDPAVSAMLKHEDLSPFIGARVVVLDDSKNSGKPYFSNLARSLSDKAVAYQEIDMAQGEPSAVKQLEQLKPDILIAPRYDRQAELLIQKWMEENKQEQPVIYYRRLTHPIPEEAGKVTENPNFSVSTDAMGMERIKKAIAAHASQVFRTPYAEAVEHLTRAAALLAELLGLAKTIPENQYSTNLVVGDIDTNGNIHISSGKKSIEDLFAGISEVVHIDPHPDDLPINAGPLAVRLLEWGIRIINLIYNSGQNGVIIPENMKGETPEKLSRYKQTLRIPEAEESGRVLASGLPGEVNVIALNTDLHPKEERRGIVDETLRQALESYTARFPNQPWVVIVDHPLDVQYTHRETANHVVSALQELAKVNQVPIRILFYPTTWAGDENIYFHSPANEPLAEDSTLGKVWEMMNEIKLGLALLTWELCSAHPFGDPLFGSVAAPVNKTGGAYAERFKGALLPYRSSEFDITQETLGKILQNPDISRILESAAEKAGGKLARTATLNTISFKLLSKPGTIESESATYKLDIPILRNGEDDHFQLILKWFDTSQTSKLGILPDSVLFEKYEEGLTTIEALKGQKEIPRVYGTARISLTGQPFQETPFRKRLHVTLEEYSFSDTGMEASERLLDVPVQEIPTWVSAIVQAYVSVYLRSGWMILDLRPDSVRTAINTKGERLIQIVDRAWATSDPRYASGEAIFSDFLGSKFRQFGIASALRLGAEAAIANIQCETVLTATQQNRLFEIQKILDHYPADPGTELREIISSIKPIPLNRNDVLILPTTENWSDYFELADLLAHKIALHYPDTVSSSLVRDVDFALRKEGFPNAVVHGNDGDPAKSIFVKWKIAPQSLDILIQDEGTRPIQKESNVSVMHQGKLILGLGEGLGHLRSLFDDVTLEPIIKEGRKIGAQLHLLKHIPTSTGQDSSAIATLGAFIPLGLLFFGKGFHHLFTYPTVGLTAALLAATGLAVLSSPIGARRGPSYFLRLAA